MPRVLIAFVLTWFAATMLSLCGAMVGIAAAGPTIAGGERAAIGVLVLYVGAYLLASAAYIAALVRAEAHLAVKVLAALAHLGLGAGSVVTLGFMSLVLLNR